MIFCQICECHTTWLISGALLTSFSSLDFQRIQSRIPFPHLSDNMSRRSSRNGIESTENMAVSGKCRVWLEYIRKRTSQGGVLPMGMSVCQIFWWKVVWLCAWLILRWRGFIPEYWKYRTAFNSNYIKEWREEIGKFLSPYPRELDMDYLWRKTFLRWHLKWALEATSKTTNIQWTFISFYMVIFFIYSLYQTLLLLFGSQAHSFNWLNSELDWKLRLFSSNAHPYNRVRKSITQSRPAFSQNIRITNTSTVHCNRFQRTFDPRLTIESLYTSHLRR